MESTFSYVGFLAAIAIPLLMFFLDPLRGIPGPLLARWTPLWMLYHSRKGDMHRIMIALHEKYGSLVRTGPNEVSISDPSAIKTIYGAGSKFRKSEWYSVWQGQRKFDLFAERDETIHRAQRRLVSNVYSMDTLKRLEPWVNQAIADFLSKLSAFEGRSIDMSRWAQLFAFDVIGEVTFSKRFGFVDEGKDDGSINQIDGALKSAAWIGQVPWLFWIHDRFSPVIGNWLGVGARHGSLRSFAADEIMERKARGSDHRDMLEMLTEIHRQKPEDMNETAVLSMATSNIFAGSDTTGITIVALLYFLCKHPRCKHALVAEITATAGREESGGVVSLSTTTRMRYLQACIYEALRCHPAVGMSLPRVVPQGGLEAEGKHLPASTIVGTNPWVIHRNKDIFGSDADIFRPERWLDGDRSQMDRFFFAFGAGSRTCIGRNLSWIEISKLIPTLLLRFDIELMDSESVVDQKCWHVLPEFPAPSQIS